MEKKLRILLLLLIDSAFAIIELVVGYAVHSLALVADSFHMFNDILSLVVALWAVQVSSSGPSPTFSYGLQRAEVLGALINAVFLLALCMTIFLEAIQRFVEPQVVSNPVLILVVGCLGLLSNLIGLVLFNEHGHSHGGMGGHSHGDLEAHAGDGHSHSHSSTGHSHSHDQANDHGHGHDQDHGHSHSSSAEADHTDDVNSTSSLLKGKAPNHTISSLLPESALAREEHRLLEQNNSYGATFENGSHHSDNGHSNGHNAHHHSRPRPQQGHGGSMNMEGVFLHVMGDALGNIGVILTALFIWKTDYSWRYYFDPVVSLVITAIIFSSAVPLCVRASKVLLQATPSFVNCNEVADDIQSIPGVEEIHDLHIWQLSENQVIGTLHATISSPSSEFTELSRTIQECFAGHGVPSITIQPEFSERGNSSGTLRQCQSNGNMLSRNK